MANHPQNLNWKDWLKENNRRVIFQNHMYRCAARDNPSHPMHGFFTGLWQDFCLNEAGIAQRDMWFDRMEFVQKVDSGEIPRPEEEIADDFNIKLK